MYDLGLLTIPSSFMVTAVLAGAFATALKKSAVGWDIRGRVLELTVLIGTLWLAAVSWGLVRAFFGQPLACLGTWGSRPIVVVDEQQDNNNHTFYATWDAQGDGSVDESSANKLLLILLRWIHDVVFISTQKYYLFWDRRMASSTPWIRSLLCMNNTAVDREDSNNSCFEFLPHANPDFFLTNVRDSCDDTDNDKVLSFTAPAKCAADLVLVLELYGAATVAYLGSMLLKYQERRHRRWVHNLRRQQQVQQLRQARRPHQD